VVLARQCAAKVGKEFLNLVIGEEDHVNKELQPEMQGSEKPIFKGRRSGFGVLSWVFDSASA